MANHTTPPPPTTNNTMYLPWSWTIESTDSATHTCPSVSGILTTFAAVNAVASFLALIFGHRRFVNSLTRGKLGKPFSSNWKYTWIITIGLNLLANAIIAGIIKHSVGYTADFKLWELMLFLLARPRLSWIVLAGVAASHGKKVAVPPDQKNAIPMDEQAQSLLKPQPTASILETENQPNSVPLPYEEPYQPVVEHVTIYDHNNNSTTHVVLKDYDLPWVNAFLSGFISEVLMQLAALYVMGSTVKFAWQHGYYNVGFNHKLYKTVPHGAHMMYAGALYYLIAGSLSLAIAGICVYAQFVLGKNKSLNPVRILLIRVIGVIALLGTTFLGSWLFWAGFVQAAGHLYCPPKLASHAAVWTLASMIGVFFGAGV